MTKRDTSLLSKVKQIPSKMTEPLRRAVDEVSDRVEGATKAAHRSGKDDAKQALAQASPPGRPLLVQARPRGRPRRRAEPPDARWPTQQQAARRPPLRQPRRRVSK